MARFYIEEETRENLIAVTFLIHEDPESKIKYNEVGIVVFKDPEEVDPNARIIEVYDDGTTRIISTRVEFRAIARSFSSFERFIPINKKAVI